MDLANETGRIGDTDYDIAMKRAQMLQDIIQNESILQTCASTTSASSISAQLKELTHKVNALTINNYMEKDTETSLYLIPLPHKMLETANSTKKEFKTNATDSRKYNSSFRKSISPSTCQFCFKCRSSANT